LETVKALAAAGAQMNVADQFGNTPLHYAAGKGAIDVVQFLIEQGSDANTRNKQGLTPFAVAVQKKQGTARGLSEQSDHALATKRG
jgi:ankyrin repeat protein